MWTLLYILTCVAAASNIKSTSWFIHKPSLDVKSQDYIGVTCPLNRKCLNHAGLWARLLACEPEALVV